MGRVRIETRTPEAVPIMAVMQRPPSVAIETLGCKVNQAESEALGRRLIAQGWCLASPRQPADAYVLNTCTVTHVADAKARHLLSRARRRHPDGLIVATGCYGQRAPQELSCLGADIVVGNGAKASLAERLHAHLGYEGRDAPALPGEPSTGGSAWPRTRSLVKIQDGCDYRCSYCIVPLVRGPARSVPADSVIAEIRERVEDGQFDITLTGPQIGSYGRDLPQGDDLAGLVRRVLSETEVVRLRLSSLQPQDVSEALLQLFDGMRLCRHVHLALQSGSDAVLRRMGRRYTAADFSRCVARIREAVPGIAITTDVVVGFPGESEADFAASLRFCETLVFARIHVFPYSRRPGTAAASLAGQVPSKVKQRRVQAMLRLAEESARRFRHRFLGSRAMVLWESKRRLPQGIDAWSGLTDNYLRVHTQSEICLTNCLVPVALQEDGQGLLWGRALAASVPVQGGGE